MKYVFSILSIFVVLGNSVFSQDIKSITFGPENGLTINKIELKNGSIIELESQQSLFSFNINDQNISSGQLHQNRGKYLLPGKVMVELTLEEYPTAWKARIVIKNISSDTIIISNIVPFGESADHVYLTGLGEERLSKSKLFIPGKAPVSVILPDNAWELGYASLAIHESNICALARRIEWENAQRKRFETHIYPGGIVAYDLFIESFRGEWQNGLKKVFQERYLYDLEFFDKTLYNRPDLQWIKKAYVIHLMMAWDHKFYSDEESRYKVEEFLARGEKLYGGDDVIGIWPTWPTLGLDDRNQWDLYRDLPGGLPALKDLSQLLKSNGTKLFIAYNPWDQSTRKENHLVGMAQLIKDTDADGVVLDTRGSSSVELQRAADNARPGVIMFSEGMAIPKDMPGIISGRVHNALYYPPILNLNKLIKPDFAIFRVAELTFERIRREYALAFFNGYGTEINMFRAGQPNWVEEDYRFLGRTTRILRENHLNFISNNWTPLINTLKDSIYVNRWKTPNKDVYTIFSLPPGGYSGPLFEVEPRAGYHFVDIWNHNNVNVETINNVHYANARLGAFEKNLLGTNNEGAVGCVVQFPKLLNTRISGSKLTVESEGGAVKVWFDSPAYDHEPINYSGSPLDIARFEGKIVVQLFDNNDELMDEEILFVRPGTPKLISSSNKIFISKKNTKGMIRVPAGEFKPVFKQGDTFIVYPEYEGPENVQMDEYFMDKYPVTNNQFETFLKATGYVPSDPANFLKNWTGGEIPEGKEDFPVVFVSKNDAAAYAAWAGKRLPAELEWQYAAQTSKLNNYPWGMEFDSTKCNPGNGFIDKVGAYPEGANPYGIEDLTGLVWQITNDTYASGSYTYTMLKGGSYYKPTSSWWYVKGGPQMLQHRQALLHVSQGFDRNATVGFRCVADIKK